MATQHSITPPPSLSFPHDGSTVTDLLELFFPSLPTVEAGLSRRPAPIGAYVSVQDGSGDGADVRQRADRWIAEDLSYRHCGKPTAKVG